MRIEPLDARTVKVVLSRADMEELCLCYEEMDGENPDTRKILAALIRQVEEASEVELSGSRLFVEAYPYADGGCILYMNALDPPGRKKRRIGFDTPLIYAFSDLNILAALAARINRELGHLILESSLYFLEGEYYLLLYTYCRLEGRIAKLLNEYGRYEGKGAVRSAFIREHGKELLRSGAAQAIERFLR